MPTPVLQLGIPETALALASTTVTNSTTYALPARLCSLAWQYFFTTNPTALTLNLQLSLDGINWGTVDSTTVTTGGIRIVTSIPAAFVRINQGAITGGAQMTAILEAKSE
jgi:hypothetical protein